jgi:hypothetical protein
LFEKQHWERRNSVSSWMLKLMTSIGDELRRKLTLNGRADTRDYLPKNPEYCGTRMLLCYHISDFLDPFPAELPSTQQMLSTRSLMSLALLCLFDAAYIPALNQAGVIQSRANQLQQTTIYTRREACRTTPRACMHTTHVYTRSPWLVPSECG